MPPEVVVPDGYSLERLDTGRHSRNEFGCGKDVLDTFLRTQASQAQGKYASATHVLIQTDVLTASGMRPVVGYVTLVSSEIPLSDCPPSIRRISDKPKLPALLLARMGVDSAHQGRGLGVCLVKHALVAAWNMNQAAGCLLVLVDAKDDDARRFYLKYGFTAMPDRPSRLFIPMKVIEKLPG